MIHFRCRPADALEWEEASFSGEQEDLLAHLFARFLGQGGWEFLAADDEGRELDWEDDDA